MKTDLVAERLLEANVIPDQIYLQVKDEYGEAVDEITWCVDKIHDTDIKYIRVPNASPCDDCKLEGGCIVQPFTKECTEYRLKELVSD